MYWRDHIHVVAVFGGPYRGCVVFAGGAASLVRTAVADSCLQLHGSPAGECSFRPGTVMYKRRSQDGRILLDYGVLVGSAYCIGLW